MCQILMTNWWDEWYTLRAKKEWYLARSAYKLEEIDKKYDLFKEAKVVLDIWCAPWSWLQYISKLGQKRGTDQLEQVIWFDIKPVSIMLPKVVTYAQDITDRPWVSKILEDHNIHTIDVIVSDMAPDTIGMSDIDGIRSIWLIEKTLRMYDTYLKDWGRFAIKVFMWPWFEELIRDLRWQYWHKNIVTFKPKSCRKKSKEIYIIKRY